LLPESELLDYLRNVSLFKDIENIPEALLKLADKLKSCDFKPGDSIITEGETGSELYLLMTGQASVYKSTAVGDQYKVAILHASNYVFFGEGGLLDSDSRSATIKADIRCTCLILARSAIDEFGKEHPQWALPILLRIARTVMERLRKTNNDLLLIYNALVSEIRGQ